MKHLALGATDDASDAGGLPNQIIFRALVHSVSFLLNTTHDR
jgi:hypothetical protein